MQVATGRGEIVGRTPLVAPRHLLHFSGPGSLPSRAKDPVAPPRSRASSGGMTSPDQTWAQTWRPDLNSDLRLDLFSTMIRLIPLLAGAVAAVSSPLDKVLYFIFIYDKVFFLLFWDITFPPRQGLLCSFLTPPAWCSHTAHFTATRFQKLVGLFNPSIHHGYYEDFWNWIWPFPKLGRCDSYLWKHYPLTHWLTGVTARRYYR